MTIETTFPEKVTCPEEANDCLFASLTQINRKPEDAPLTEGERIVVPRYLAPMAAPVVSYAPAGR